MFKKPSIVKRGWSDTTHLDPNNRKKPIPKSALNTPFTGPYVVTAKLGESSYRIRPVGFPKANEEVVNIVNLKYVPQQIAEMDTTTTSSSPSSSSSSSSSLAPYTAILSPSMPSTVTQSLPTSVPPPTSTSVNTQPASSSSSQDVDMTGNGMESEEATGLEGEDSFIVAPKVRKVTKSRTGLTVSSSSSAIPLDSIEEGTEPIVEPDYVVVDDIDMTPVESSVPSSSSPSVPAQLPSVPIISPPQPKPKKVVLPPAPSLRRSLPRAAPPLSYSDKIQEQMRLLSHHRRLSQLPREVTTLKEQRDRKK